MRLEDAVRADAHAGRFQIARSSYVDPAVLDLEREGIFSRCWLYVGHASELGRPGDFLTRNIAGRHVVFVRDDAGAIRCFLNVCPHRGAQITKQKRGNATHFTCFYHGWTFNNRGAVTRIVESDNYSCRSTGPGCNDLVPVPRFEEYRGLWFLNYDRAAPSLDEYLGRAREYIDIVMDQAEERMTVVGDVLEYSARANWKLLAENSVDVMHVYTLHSTYLDLIQKNSGGTMGRGKILGKTLDLGNGHSVVERAALYGRPVARWIPHWGEEAKADIEETYRRLVRAFGTERADRIANNTRNLLVFPNLVINDIMAVTLRTFQPLTPDFMEISAWALAPVEELGKPAMQRRLTNFLEFLGPAGFATPDDIDVMESCQRAFGSAREAPWNDLSKGFGMESRATDETPQRAFWLAWQKRLSEATP